MINRKIFYMIILILFLCFTVYCIDLHNYEKELVKFIKSDGSNESIDYNEGMLPPGPTCFAICEDNFIYVCDILQERIVIYDLRLNFIKAIKSLEKQMNIIFADNIKLDNEKNMYLNLNKRKIVKFNKEGRIVYTIKDTKIKRNIFSLDNYYPINNDLFFYDDNKKIRAVDKQGKILSNEESKKMASMIKLATKNKLEDPIDNRIEQFMDENNLLYINEQLLNGDFSIHRKYYNLKKDLDKSRSANNVIDIDYSDYYDYRLIGYDKVNNAYWKAYWNDDNHIKEIILVFAADGNLVDVFYNNLSHSIQVAPNGDLYGMVLGNGGVTFYKIPRQW